MYKLIFYVPETHLESVKEALFGQGAGQDGAYDRCCWQMLGQGQFRPLSGSQPYLGESGKLTLVAEYKVEMLCAPGLIKDVVRTLLSVHPYERPAYEIYPILTVEDFN